MKISVIIPVFNEENTIEKVIETVGRVDLGSDIEKEIIVVNDGSTDKTGKILEKLPSNKQHIIYHNRINLGKGSAVRIGYSLASGDICIIQDADLELDPNEYPKLI